MSFRIVTYDLGAVYFHALPLPTAKAKNLLVEIIRESLRPLRMLGKKISVKNVLQGLTVANLLIASCLIDQCRYADMRKTTHKHLSLKGFVHLLCLQCTSVSRLKPNVANIG